MKIPAGLPRLGVYEDPEDMRQWLTEGEARMVEAANCADLSVRIEVSVRLAGKKRSRKKYKTTPEEEAREKQASALLDDCFKAHTAHYFTEAMRHLSGWRRDSVKEAPRG